MKTTQCKRWFGFAFCLAYVMSILHTSSLNAQSIRKNYREFTDAERIAYINALYDLKDNGTIEDYAGIHNEHFGDIHQVPDFLPWHRMFLKSMEDELRSVSPDITIPYWDWRNSEDRSSGSLLWTQNWLGQFNSAWSLGRSLSGGTGLPTSADIASVQAATDFDDYWDLLEQQHNRPHNWVGGQMATGFSPRDPVFFWHHAIIDKLWQEWQEATGLSSFEQTALHFPYSETDPNSIVDSRAEDIKVWYANNGTVVLDKYTVTGTETYKYTGVIYASTSSSPQAVFTVPNGTTCNFESASTIVLRDGFTAASGSIFSAKISSVGGSVASQGDEQPVLSEASDIPTEYALSGNYPNPFNPSTMVSYRLADGGWVSLKVYDVLGREVATLVDRYNNPGEYRVQFDATALPSGVYIYRLNVNDFTSTKKMVLLK